MNVNRSKRLTAARLEMWGLDRGRETILDVTDTRNVF